MLTPTPPNLWSPNLLANPSQSPPNHLPITSQSPPNLLADAWEAQPTITSAGGQAELAMRLRVTNEGARRGADVVQLYIAFPAAADEPPLLLRGFEKTPLLAPGASASVSFHLPVATGLAVWHGAIEDASGGWRTVAGNYTVQVGPSSRDVRLTHGLELASG